MNAFSYKDTVSGEGLLHSVFNLKRQLIYLPYWGLNLKATAFGSVALGVGAKANKLNSVAIVYGFCH